MADEASYATPTLESMTKYGPMQLDALLRLEEPEKTLAVRSWIEAGAQGLLDESDVKIVASDGKRFETSLGNKLTGRRWVIGHQGARVPRIVAYKMLLRHGEAGSMRGRDIKTGYTRFEWTTFQNNHPQLAKIYYPEGTQPTFLDSYLTQAVEGDEAGVLLDVS